MLLVIHRFWQFGEWIDVVIDDRLPTANGQLLFAQLTDKNEFWCALLEKAYAKLNGSYGAIEGGLPSEAMEDFTGGISEMYLLSEVPQNLFSILLKAYEANSMINCGILKKIEPEESEVIGLAGTHAYSITKVQFIEEQYTGGKIKMVRVRNPWGTAFEWNGPWSDWSPEWNLISKQDKVSMGLTFNIEGEFWMSFADWIQNFYEVEVCNLSPDSLIEKQLNGCKKQWEMSQLEGEWTADVTAGGSDKNRNTFWLNPQYVMSLEDRDTDCDEGKCTVIIGLMQKNRRSQHNNNLFDIGFVVYNVGDRDLRNKPLKMDFFKYKKWVERSPVLSCREVIWATTCGYVVLMNNN